MTPSEPSPAPAPADAPPGQADADTNADTVEYLSDAWLERADRAVRELPPVPSDLAVAVVVTDGPSGERRYRLVLGPDRVAVSAEPEPAGVRMTLAWADATAIARGRSSAQRAFLDGRLRLGGDTSLLLGHQEALAAIDDRLASLRAVTRFA